MNEEEKKCKLLKVFWAIDGCLGMEIPYALTQRMALLSNELNAYIKQLEGVEGGREREEGLGASTR